jgi:hypothetical protein
MMNIFLLLATSYWTYCSLFSVFVLVALFLEKRELDRCMQKQDVPNTWQNYLRQTNDQGGSCCLERVYVSKNK